MYSAVRSLFVIESDISFYSLSMLKPKNSNSATLSRNIDRQTGVAKPDEYATHHIVAGDAPGD